MNYKNKVIDFSRHSSRVIDQIMEHIGQFTSYLVIIMVLLVGYDVTMRYVFNQGSIAIQELQWHLFSLIFLMGAAYTLKHDEHVRLDLFYQSRLSNKRTRAWINLIGSLIFLLPFCLLIINSSWFFVMQSWSFNEGSPDPGGLAYRWLLKATIPLGFLLLLIQGLSEIMKNLTTLLEKES